jgi:hypothetical protein
MNQNFFPDKKRAPIKITHLSVSNVVKRFPAGSAMPERDPHQQQKGCV